MAHPTRSDKTAQAATPPAAKLQAREQRQARLAAALRANLAKRKQQARGRAEAGPATATAADDSQPATGEAQVGRTGEVA